MNRKIEEIFNQLEPNLEETDIRKITSSVGIKNHGKNPTNEQEEGLKTICQLIVDGESVESAISKVSSLTDKSSENSRHSMEQIILEQANKAADAALMSLPNVAQSEIERLRQSFIKQFRIRIKQRLNSPEFQQQFASQMECLGEQAVFNSSTTNTALLDSSSSNS